MSTIRELQMLLIEHGCDQLGTAFCRVLGHEWTLDQCGHPLHASCVYCFAAQFPDSICTPYADLPDAQEHESASSRPLLPVQCGTSS